MNLTELNKAIADLYAVQNPQPKVQRERMDSAIDELQSQKQRVCGTNPQITILDSEIQELSTTLNALKKKRKDLISQLPECKQIDDSINQIQAQKRKVYGWGNDYDQQCHDFEASVLSLIIRWASGLNVSEEKFFKYWQKVKDDVNDHDNDYYCRINEFRMRTDALIELILLFTDGE